MTAAECLFHPWLAGTAEELQAVRAGQQPPAAKAARAIIADSTMAEESLLSLNGDVSMAAINTPAPNGVQQDMSLDGGEREPGSYSQVTSASQNPTYRMPGAFHTGARQQSRYALQRRSRVIADAEANGHRLPEPSVEMLAQAAANQSDNTTPNSSNPLKRKAANSNGRRASDSSLTPLPEDRPLEEDELMGGMSSEQEQEPIVRRSKRGRNSAEPGTPQRGGQRGPSAKKRGGRAGGRAVEPIGEEENDILHSPAQDLGVRRSPRNVSGGRR
jgi:hypothetical protein